MLALIDEACVNPSGAVDSLDGLYDHIHRKEPELDNLRRIAMVISERNGVLHTFKQCGDGGNVLNNYTAPLVNIPSLMRLARSGQPRIIDDRLAFGGLRKLDHAEAIQAAIDTVRHVSRYRADSP